MPETIMHKLRLNNAESCLQAEAGELILLRGDAGSGKSAWLKRMAGLMDLPEASMRMSKHAVVRMLFDRWPCVWLGGNVEEELMFGLGALPSRAQLEETLSNWRLSDLSLTKEVRHLNRLQSLRLSLAAIDLAKPELVLLDNPSAALCEETALILAADIAAWARQSNTIVVVASNRWQDWHTVVTQTWSVSTADQLPTRL